MNPDWRYWPDGVIRVTRKVVARLHLSPAGWAAFFGALVTMILATVGLLTVSHDVLDHGGLAQHDPARLNFIIGLRSGWSVELSRIVTQLGSADVLVVLALAAGGLLWWRGAGLGIVLAPVLVLGLSALLVAVLKALVHRVRPPLSLRLVTENEPSFPSGHSTNSAALLLVGISGLAAMFIGLSRLVLGVHWPTDVLAGWCLGALVCLLVTTAVLALPNHAHRPPAGTGRFANVWWHLERVATVRRTQARPDPQPS
jgi:membrane-associated phospholipid phosphatase